MKTAWGDEVYVAQENTGARQAALAGQASGPGTGCRTARGHSLPDGAWAQLAGRRATSTATCPTASVHTGCQTPSTIAILPHAGRKCTRRMPHSAREQCYAGNASASRRAVFWLVHPGRTAGHPRPDRRRHRRSRRRGAGLVSMGSGHRHVPGPRPDGEPPAGGRRRRAPGCRSRRCRWGRCAWVRRLYARNAAYHERSVGDTWNT